MSNKGQLLQDPFLNLLRKEHVPVSIYLVNGIKLQGQIESFDQYVVLLRNTVTQMVYKHAISTVVPGRAVNFHAAEADRAGRLTRHAASAASTLSSDRFDRRQRSRRPCRAPILVGVDFGRHASFRRRRSTNWRCWPNRPATSPVARVIARRKAPDAALFVGSRQGRRDQGAGRRRTRRHARAVRPGAVARRSSATSSATSACRWPTARC